MIFTYSRVSKDKIDIANNDAHVVGTFITYYNTWLFRAADSAHAAFTAEEMLEMYTQLKALA